MSLEFRIESYITLREPEPLPQEELPCPYRVPARAFGWRDRFAKAVEKEAENLPKLMENTGEAA